MTKIVKIRKTYIIWKKTNFKGKEERIKQEDSNEI